MRCASIKTLNDTQFLTLSSFIMSKSIALSLLSKGNNGNEILSILDVITADNSEQQSEVKAPTLDVIEF